MFLTVENLRIMLHCSKWLAVYQMVFTIKIRGCSRVQFAICKINDIGSDSPCFRDSPQKYFTQWICMDRQIEKMRGMRANYVRTTSLQQLGKKINRR